MGDSISQGIGTPNFEADAFPARLAERWRAKGCTVELKNVGIAGYTAADLIANEVPEITPFRPTFITLQVGANDIVNAVPIETYRTQLRSILDAAKKSGARVVVLPQNDWPRSPEGMYYEGAVANRVAFDTVLIDETKAKGVELLDLRPLYGQHADKKLWAADGVHPTPACYDEIAAELARLVPSPCGK
jgi:acyl-CoA thioesterase-1